MIDWEKLQTIILYVIVAAALVGFTFMGTVIWMTL